MIRWIEVTRYGADRKVPVNMAMIAWVDQTPGGSMIYFGGGGSLRVSETVDEVKALSAAGEDAPDQPDATTFVTDQARERPARHASGQHSKGGRR